jgi:hypothetical protein
VTSKHESPIFSKDNLSFCDRQLLSLSLCARCKLGCGGSPGCALLLDSSEIRALYPSVSNQLLSNLCALNAAHCAFQAPTHPYIQKLQTCQAHTQMSISTSYHINNIQTQTFKNEQEAIALPRFTKPHHHQASLDLRPAPPSKSELKIASPSAAAARDLLAWPTPS